MTLRPHPRDPSPRVAIAIGVVALAAAVASVMPQLHANTWVFRDGRFYVNVATTITESLSLDQHEFAASWYTGTLGWNADLDPGWSNVALGAHGEHFPKHPWIHPLLASPAYFAFGLPATLAWNLLMFALIGAGLYRFARAYASPTAAALAVATFVFGTAIVQSAYDFSVDVLMLALFAQGLAAVIDGKGARAGLLVALCVVIKPTALMLMPALALVLAERRDGRELGRSLVAGTAVLLSYAGINTWMYGRPWWSGYNRTLVTRGGQPVIADHLDAFSMPFVEGFQRMWGGSYGLVHTFTVVALGAPGLIAMARRRPLHALGVAFSVIASLLVFSKYEYEGHRFHWPALALVVPSMAVTLELAGASWRRLTSRGRVSAPGAGAIAACTVIVSAVSVLPFGGTMEQRVMTGPWGASALDAARALGLEGSPSALAVLALHFAVAAVLVSALVRVIGRVAPPAVAGFAVAACAMLPEIRDAVLAGGPVAIGVAALVVAVDRTLDRKWIAALVGGVIALGAWTLLPDREGDARSVLALVAEAWDQRVGVRLLLPWLALALPGIAIAWSRDERTGLALAGLALVMTVPSIGGRGGAWSPIATLPLIAGAAVCADAIGRRLARATARIDARRGAMVFAAALVLLLAIGGVRRAVAASQPFRIATHEGAREAVVMHEDVPCDFLAWEHMSWECSHFDAGLFGMVGLAVSEGVRVGGEERELMVVPTGRSGQTRRVIWPDVRAGRRLDLRWAVPDDQRGDVILEVRVDDREVASIEIPARGDGAIHEQSIDTGETSGRGRLELRVRPRVGRRQGLVAVDGVWR